jgi:membrane protein implicated in regulation of membrane protease activity
MVAGQSRTGSAVESATNVLVGYGLALLSQMVIYSVLDIPVPMRMQLLIGVWFTAVSLVRTYVVRRCFNRWTNTERRDDAYREKSA